MLMLHEIEGPRGALASAKKMGQAFENGLPQLYCYYVSVVNAVRLQWSRSSVLAFGTQVRGFKPGRSRRIFRAKKSSARLPSEGK
jgi:hypothetical protein